MSDTEENKENTSPSEQQNDTTVNNVNDIEPAACSVCGDAAVRICVHCGQDFCTKHSCITHELGSERIPLTDEDGVTHKGRRIRLVGEGWPTELSMINELADEELEVHIRGLQKLLKTAIETTDYALVSIARAEYVRDYKRHSRYVAAMKRREKIVFHSTSGKKARGGTKVPNDIAALMALGLSYEKAVEMKSLLGKKK